MVWQCFIIKDIIEDPRPQTMASNRCSLNGWTELLGFRLPDRDTG